MRRVHQKRPFYVQSLNLLLLGLCFLATMACGSAVRYSNAPGTGQRPGNTPVHTGGTQNGAAEIPTQTQSGFIRGIASYYGAKFHGRPTANGEVFDQNEMTAAHKTLPFGTVVRVKHVGNGREVIVRINDRGPFIKGRVLDLSRAAAEKLDMIREGLAMVEITIIQ